MSVGGVVVAVGAGSVVAFVFTSRLSLSPVGVLGLVVVVESVSFLLSSMCASVFLASSSACSWSLLGCLWVLSWVLVVGLVRLSSWSRVTWVMMVDGVLLAGVG